MEDGKLTEVKLYPIDLGMELPRPQKGLPVINGNEETLRYLAKISEDFGTQIEIKDGVGYICL